MADTTYTTALVLNQITDEFGIPQDDVVFRGGGKGQRASASGFSTADGMLTGKGSSRTLAAQDLLTKIREFYAAIEAAEALTADDDTEHGAEESDEEMEALGIKAPRATVEDAIEAIRLVFPGMDIIEEDDDRTPGPVWSEDASGNPVLVSITPCVGECMEGKSDVCDCRCSGANHGLMRLALLPGVTWTAVRGLRPVPFGPKPCLCGCGETTDRKFVPGHDARYHARIKYEAERAALGLSVEEYAEHRKQQARDKAKARRQARRAARATETPAG